MGIAKWFKLGKCSDYGINELFVRPEILMVLEALSESGRFELRIFELWRESTALYTISVYFKLILNDH